MSASYDDIIDLPHHVSITRTPMPIANRAAQFSPFAALTGYDAAIAETARLTDKRIELSENDKDELNMKLIHLTTVLIDHPKISVTYYQPDDNKAGGAYVTKIDIVKKVDDYEHTIVFMNGDAIMIDDILDLDIVRSCN